MNKHELLQISYAINDLAKAKALETQANIVIELAKIGKISMDEAEVQLSTIYNRTQMIGL